VLTHLLLLVFIPTLNSTLKSFPLDGGLDIETTSCKRLDDGFKEIDLQIGRASCRERV
jgi:hypothetical protein